MKMIFRCEWIKTGAGYKPKADENGAYLRSENGQYVYEPCERFSIRLAPVGFRTRVGAVTDPSVHENAKIWVDVHGVSGSITLENISEEAVREFKVGCEYCIEPMRIGAP